MERMVSTIPVLVLTLVSVRVSLSYLDGHALTEVSGGLQTIEYLCVLKIDNIFLFPFHTCFILLACSNPVTV